MARRHEHYHPVCLAACACNVLRLQHALGAIPLPPPPACPVCLCRGTHCFNTPGACAPAVQPTRRRPCMHAHRHPLLSPSPLGGTENCALMHAACPSHPVGAARRQTHAAAWCTCAGGRLRCGRPPSRQTAGDQARRSPAQMPCGCGGDETTSSSVPTPPFTHTHVDSQAGRDNKSHGGTAPQHEAGER